MMKRRMLSLLLCLSMLMSLSLPAMAQGEADAVNSAGSYSTYVIRSDSSLWGFGRSYTGNGNSEVQVLPVKILDNVRSVSGGDSLSSVAVKKDDTLWGWGFFDGYIAGSQDATYLYPTQLEIDDVKSAATCGRFVVVLKNDDTLWLCGDMYLGDGTMTQANTSSGFVKIADDIMTMHATDTNIFYVTNDNTLWGYGDNSYAQLGNMSDAGDGSSNNDIYYSPVSILDDVVEVSADPEAGVVFAVRKDTSLYAWGTKGFYAEGYGWVEDAGKPYKVMDGVKSAAVEGDNAFIVKTDKTLWAWGYSYEGKSVGDEKVPYYVTDSVQSVSMGERHATVVKTDNSLWVLGGNYRKALGYDTDEIWYTPLTKIMDDVIDAPADWAVEEVELAIGEKLIPSDMQSDYTSPVTREEFCILAIRMIEVRSGMSIDEYISEVGTVIAPSNTFEDCDTKEVLAAKTLGITDGTSPTTFDPNRLLTRQEAAKFLTTTAMACGRDVELSTPAYADKEAIANWAQDYTGYVYDINVMKGVGANKFDPKGGYQRQQAFMTMYRIWRAIDAVDTNNVDLPEEVSEEGGSMEGLSDMSLLSSLSPSYQGGLTMTGDYLYMPDAPSPATYYIHNGSERRDLDLDDFTMHSVYNDQAKEKYNYYSDAAEGTETPVSSNENTMMFDLDMMVEYFGDNIKAEREELNGWQTVKVELGIGPEDGIRYSWYSIDYLVMVKSIVIEDGQTTVIFSADTIEESPDIDHSLFEKPGGITFY